MLYPFLLTPAFRCGEATPWGGTLLHDLLGKECLDLHTGESLEMSVIPGLESRDPQGNKLSDLLARYGAELAGTACTGAFPLLLKLIDARKTLSVQVHPDDAYAGLWENKQGKTEAWVILQAEPDARLVYGVNAGVTREQLAAAAADGAALEGFLRFIPVQAGDVLYIPSGMVHAIGGGILLYEIQQSSDVTYRFYDWNRLDAQGRKRTLHIRQALDVTRLDLQLDPAVPKLLPDASCERSLLLDTPYFRLLRLRCCRNTPFQGETTRFSVLTALSEGTLETAGKDARITLRPGQSVFIPADCAPFGLNCEHCLLASPGV